MVLPSIPPSAHASVGPSACEVTWGEPFLSVHLGDCGLASLLGQLQEETGQGASGTSVQYRVPPSHCASLLSEVSLNPIT